MNPGRAHRAEKPESLFKAAPYMQALEETKDGQDGRVMANKVAVLAKGLETALASLSD